MDNETARQTETYDPAKVGHFDLVLHQQGQTVDVLEIPLDLLKDIIADTNTIDVDGGYRYTLIPHEDSDVEVLRLVYRVFKQLDEPNRYQYVLQQRADALVKAVGTMFGKIKYKRVDTRADVVDLINFHNGKNSKHRPTIVERPRIGTMYARVVDGEAKDDE